MCMCSGPSGGLPRVLYVHGNDDGDGDPSTPLKKSDISS